MKVGIVGSGLVGSTAAYALLLQGVASDIVLVDLNRKRAEAEAADISHAAPFVRPVDVFAGEYADLAGSGVVIIAAGANQRPGETRLELLSRNAEILRMIIPQILEYAPEAILLMATNPVDVLTHLAARYAAEHGVPASRVIGSGTTLDTARFRALLGDYLEVDPPHVHGYVVGEHGDSEVLTWSIVDIAGVPLAEFVRLRELSLTAADRERIDDGVRRAAYAIIEGKGATYYGIGAALARIVDVIAHDHRAILTVCTPAQAIPGVPEVTVSLPHLVGGSGVIATLPLQLSEEEDRALVRSARLIRALIDQYEAGAR